MNGCMCIPYKNICCCGPKDGISVTQPECQRLPDGNVYTNPVYLSNVQKSYWTYKTITDCAPSTRGISSIVIPICNKITDNNIVVYERINCCTVLVPISFEIKDSDPFFGDSPVGFNWLKIETSERFDKGVCVAYLLEIQGDFPFSSQSIQIKAATNKLVFDCDCFKMPTCPPEGKLTIKKKCEKEIIDNRLFLRYELEVANIGEAALPLVLFEDIIFYDTSFKIGDIDVNPTSLSVNISTPDEIIITGSLGTINPSQTIPIKYDIEVENYSSPGSFTFANMASVTSGSQVQTAKCNTNVKVIKLRGDKCCIIEGDNVIFRFSIANQQGSPATEFNYRDRMTIPDDLTVKFLDFDGCTAIYEDTGDPVIPNTDVVGPRAIIVFCNNIPLGPSTALIKNIRLQVVDVTKIPGAVGISNTLREVTLSNPDQELLLPLENVPVTAEVDVTTKIECKNPCEG